MSEEGRTRSLPGLLTTLRKLERHNQSRPRIGRSKRVREEVVDLGQDPFLAFPDQDLADWEETGKRPKMRARFLGFFGPFGALPLNTTEEVLRWFQRGDRSFVAFTDVLVTRFLQLFFRSWSDARPITQFDHEKDDRFQTMLLSLVGLGTPGFRNRDSVSDTVKLRISALAIGRVRSPIRLQQMLSLHFQTRVEVEEMIPSWMEFEPDSLSRVGTANASLGRNVHLGSRVISVGEKLRINIHVKDLRSYRRLIPGGEGHAHMRDIVDWYLGQTLTVEVAVHLPASAMPAPMLGETMELGWISRLPPLEQEPHDKMVVGTTYTLEPVKPPAPETLARAA